MRPAEPGEDAVSVNPAGEDRRPLIILVTSAGILMAFGVLMWLTAHGGETAPLADRGTYDVLAGPGEGRRPGDGPDDEKPLTA